MGDLKWNIELNDIAIENGDFVITENISNQNSFLILSTKNCFLTAPLVGVGAVNFPNSNRSEITKMLNEWQSQVLKDGAKDVSFELNLDNTFTTNAIY